MAEEWDSIHYKGTWYNAPQYDLSWVIRKDAAADMEPDLGAIESPFNKSLITYDSETVINVPAEQPTIQAGINAAKAGDTVLVNEGYYYENINFKGKAITVASKFILDRDDIHIAQTVIDGSMPAHLDTASVVFIGGGLDSTTVLSGFTITGGKGSKRVRPTRTLRIGGGIFVELSGAKVENNIITRNSVTDPSFEVSGGGIFAVNNTSSQNLVIRNNRIFNNHISGSTYTQGGGILVAEPYGMKLIENNDIFQNTATCIGNYKANGGGINIGTWEPWNTPIIVRNNRIYENEIHCVASQGGGIFLTFPEWGTETHSGKAPIEIYNNLIANNSSEDRGGAIGIWDQGNKAYDIEDPNPLIYNNTIIGNTAKEGGGIFNFEMNALLMNNIMINNGSVASAREISLRDINYIYGYFANQGRFQSYNNDIRGGLAGAGNIDKDPKTDAYDFSLKDISPCIGRGIDSVHINGNWYYAPAYDLKGVNRLMASADGEIDMGALESTFERLNPAYDSEHIINVPEEEYTIQAAINAAAESDTVLVAPGLYYENINFKGKAITVMSHYGMDKDVDHQTNTVIDGSMPAISKKASVVTFNSGEDTTSILKGFTIRGGVGSEVEPFPGVIAKGGGGIMMFSSGGKIENNIIKENKVESATMEVAGGGIVYGERGNNVIIRNNKILNNEIKSPWTMGAGIRVSSDKGYILIEGNEINNNINTCTSWFKAMGGGLLVQKAYGTDVKIVVNKNYIHHNELHCQSTVGGGIYNVFYRDAAKENLETNIPVEYTNNIISENYSEDQGGGIAIWNMANYYGLKQTVPDPILINNTIINNRSANGAGIFNYDAETLLMNNILWDDLSANNCKEIFNEDVNYPGGWAKNENVGILHSFHNDIRDGWEGGENETVADPLCKLTTFALESGSPCIGTGTTMVEVNGTSYYAPVTDYNGNPRPNSNNNLVDIGAIESMMTGFRQTVIDSNPLRIYPNPASDLTTISFNLQQKTNVRLSIFNLLGQEEMILLNEEMLPGAQEVSFNVAELTKGLYIVKLLTDRNTSAKLIVKE
ncbi:MAG: right-handed parallel beta-helix repeat-containing protein [Bacteroidales bacterium]|nr:right-handed parallel beta-helix repeat-containing protein [Bacteroidales bacterium]MCF8389408.1 right-handed parallel beta-helix repeat-containing protein [Bacteroidales bacterium]